MNKKIKVILVGAGNRANVYASVSLKHPELFEVVGIVDPDPVRNKLMMERFNVPKENCFSYVSELIKREKFADAVINGTMDDIHVETSIPVLRHGYDLLLEKPFAVNAEEAKRLFEVAKECGRKVYICHVLRYTPFYSSIKKHLIDGEIGKIISIETCEHVNYHHMAVSYVRGKWRSEKLCAAPMLLAKSCHDIDIIMWMMNETRPVSVTSFGGDFQFGKDRKPTGAGERCLIDCPYKDSCNFSAYNNYVRHPRWKQYVWKAIEGNPDQSIENVAESLKTYNHYGQCVWDFERDGNVDHQSVMIGFESGATATFQMIGGAARSERNIHIVGTKGEIKGTFEDSKYILRKIAPETQSGYVDTVIDLNVTGDMTGEKGGHGGGDSVLAVEFIEAISGSEPSYRATTLEDSLISHSIVFAAEKSRKSGGAVQKL